MWSGVDHLSEVKDAMNGDQMKKITAQEIRERDGGSLKSARRVAKAVNAIVALLAPLGCCEAKRQLQYFSAKIHDPCDRLSR
jgi:hypothetical protein